MTTRSSRKDKYTASTLEATTSSHAHDTNTNTNTNSNQGNQTNTNFHNPFSLFGGLSGNGASAFGLKGPEFRGNDGKFNIFKYKLDNWLMTNDLYKVIDDETCEPRLNLALYLHIANCLDGEPLNHICANAKQDGRKAYKILCEKYLGNIHARKQKIYTELATLKQKENESISTYISRIDMLIEQISVYKVFNDSTYFVTCAMTGLLPKYEIFKAVVNSSEDYPTWPQFKIRIQNHAQLNTPTDTSHILAVMANNPPVSIVKSKKNNNRKFKNNYHKTANMYCTYCDTKTHFSSDCRHKDWIMSAGGLRQVRGGGGRGNNRANSGNNTAQRGRGTYNNAHYNGTRGAPRGRGNRGRGTPMNGTGRGNHNKSHNVATTSHRVETQSRGTPGKFYTYTPNDPRISNFEANVIENGLFSE